jgi:uncharacterized protein YycO
LNLQPGDLIFYPDDGYWRHSIFAWLQKKTGELGTIKDPVYTHVAMISSEPDLIVEMKWPRPAFRFFADDTREKIILRPKCDDKIKLRAIYWCYFNIDAHYSFWNMLFGKMNLTTAYKVCSGFVDTAYKEAGFSLTPMSDKCVSPNELASSDKLIKL